MTNLLWTGGFDSTFRLLAIANDGRPPPRLTYVIDQDRKSLGLEIHTMTKVKTVLREKWGYDPGEIRFIDKRDIPIDAAVREKYETLSARYRVGVQYLWLASLAEQLDEPLEVCLVATRTRSNSFKHDLLHRLVQHNDVWVFDPQFAEEDFSLFRSFHFPLIMVSKLEMLRTATQAGFRKELLLSHFCHLPQPSGRPCGCCQPCRDAMDEGLAARLPFLIRQKARIKAGSRRCKQHLKSALLKAGVDVKHFR